jgi:hypothetical protein
MRAPNGRVQVRGAPRSIRLDKGPESTEVPDCHVFDSIGRLTPVG